MRDRTVGDTFYMKFTTRAFATGVPTTLSGTPVVSAYEDSSTTQITAGITLGADHDSVTGLNLLTIVATGANGYESGKDYSLVITTGTVGGVSVVGEVVGEFSLSLSAAAVDLANGTDGLTALKTGIDDIPTVAEFNARTLTSASYFDSTTDTVATVTNLTNAPTNGDLTATMKTSVTTAATAATPTAAAVTATVSADIVSVSGDTTAADNLESQYDETGLTGDTFPATQAAVGNISSGTAAINTTAESFTKAGAEPETNDYTATAQLDGVLHIVEDDATSTDAYYTFDIGGNGVPVAVQWQGYAQSNGDTYTIHAYNWGSTSYEQIGSISASNGTTVVTNIYDLTNVHVGTGANLGKVRFRFLSSDGTAFATDRLLCSYTIVAQSVGYADGAIWVDTVNGTAGVEPYVNGVADNPVLTWANALTLSSALGLTRFHIINGSTITLSANSDGYTLMGDNWTLALGGQSIADAFFSGASVTGTATGTGHEFHQCLLANGGAFTAAAGFFLNCALAGDITLNSAGGTFYFDNCFSGVAGTATPSIDVGAAVGNTNLNMRHYSGGIEVENLGVTGTDTMSLEGHGQLVINANCTGGTIAMRGHFTITDNAGGAVTVSDDARYDVAQINAQADLALTDYDPPTNAQMEARTLVAADYFDPAADTVANVTTVTTTTTNTDMRGTDGAATHSAADVWTAVTRTLTANTNLNDPTAAAIADQVWEELIADHSGTSGSTAEALAAAGSAGDPWTTALPGSYTGTQAGKILADVLDDTNELQGNQGDWATATTVDLNADQSGVTIGTVTTNADMRGTDGANTVIPMTAALSQTEHDATQTAVSGLNDVAATDIVSNGAITTLAGAVVNVDTVDTTTTNTDMRGTNSAATATALATHDGKLDTVDANVDAVLIDTDTTIPALIAALNDLSASEVNTEMLDVLKTDVSTLPSQGAPTATPTIEDALMYLYKSWRNKKDNDGSSTQLYADDGSTVDHKQTTSESGGTVTKAEWESGP